MKPRLTMVVAVGLLVGAGATWADEQADAKALLDRATKAMGGPAKLAKLSTVSGKAKLIGSKGGQEVTVDIDGTWQGLNQYRAALDIQDAGQNLKAILVINGDKGWFKKMDNTEEAPQDVVPFIRNIFYAGRMPQMLPALADPAYKLSPLGEVKIGAQTAVGLSISHKDFKDVSLYFDKDSGLPIKSEIRLTEPRRDNEQTIEYHFSDYKDFDGLKLCSKITIKLDDQHEFRLELGELKAVNKVPDDQFEMP